MPIPHPSRIVRARRASYGEIGEEGGGANGLETAWLRDGAAERWPFGFDSRRPLPFAPYAIRSGGSGSAATKAASANDVVRGT